MDRILVVEDDRVWRQIILGGELERAGYSVDTVTNLAEAIEKLESGSYHVVLTDISLDLEPENYDGVKLLQWIREKYPTIKTLAISSRPVLGFKKEFFKKRYGALEYIERKDFEPRQFLELVAKAVRFSKEASQRIEGNDARNKDSYSRR